MQPAALWGILTEMAAASSTKVCALGVCALLGMVAGCQQSDLATASGTVTVNGVPLTGGSIQFLPSGGGPSAFGDIQPDGTFRLMTREPYDGAKPGSYWVSIMSDASTTSPTTPGKSDDRRLSYRSPQDHPLTILADSDNQLVIDVRKEDGWQIVEDD
jgi:hypothetical protein